LQQVLRMAVLIVAIFTTSTSGFAQPSIKTAVKEPSASASTAPGQTNALAMSSAANPRSLMERVRAAVVADDPAALGPLVEWPPQYSAKQRETAKTQLADVLNRFGDFNPPLISSSPLGDPDNGDDPTKETVGTINTGKIKVPIVLQNFNTTANASAGSWRISRQTIENLPNIESQPPSWIESIITSGPYGKALMTELAGLEIWQWLGALLFLFACILLGKVIAWSVDKALARSSRLGRWRSDGTAQGLTVPVAVVIAATVFRVVLPSLGIPIEYRETLLTAIRLVQIFFVTLLFIRLVHIGFLAYTHMLHKADRAAASALLPPLRKAIKTIVWLGGLITAMRAVGFDVSAIIAGLGVGGLAVALASQKTVENLFGGISVVLDQPVRVGETGKYGAITGVVEDIGLRSTRIRTPDRSIVTIPNAEFSQIQIENLTSRDRIRYTMILGIRYDTSMSQLRMLLHKLRELLAKHPRVLPEPRRVTFLNLGASAIEIEILAYIDTPDYDRYLEIREELNFSVLDIVAECGTECAYPTQSTYSAVLEPLSQQARQTADAYIAKHTGKPST
jgi:MscS family membrane protein